MKQQQSLDSEVAQSPSTLLFASLWMMLGLVSFLVLMIGVRELATSMSVFQMLSMRSAVALVVLVVWALIARKGKLSTQCFTLHLTRNTCHFVGQYCWAVGIALLPLSQVIAIEFTTPIWAVLLASLFLKQALSLSRMLVLLAGFAGVLIIVRPGIVQFNGDTLYVFAATIGFALTMLTTSKLNLSESAWTILFYMALIQLFLGLGPAVYGWVWPEGVDYFWIVLVGVSGMLAHLGLTRALALADTASILPLDYLRLPATVLIGLLIYDESADWLVLLGASVIFVANYFHLRAESRMLSAD